MSNIEKIKPTGIFTNYIYKAIPLAFDDSMSYYETLCSLLDYLKTTTEVVNNNADLIAELESFVNNYFNDLDVQEEINNKLDSFVTDGTFATILNQELLQDINNRVLQNSVDIGAINENLSNKVSSNQPNSVNMNMLTQEVRTALTGGSTAIVGNDTVGTENVKDKAITIYKLDDLLQTNFIKEYVGIDFSFNYQGYKNVIDGELNISTESFYSYADIPLTINTIYYFAGFNIFRIQGLVILDSEDNIIYSTPIADITQRHEAVSTIFKANTSGLHAIINTITTITNAGGNYPSPIKLLPSLTKLNVLTQNFMNNPDLTPAPIKTITGYYTSFTHAETIENTVPYFVSYENASVDIYKLSKGIKYSVTSANRSSICGLQITDEAFNTSYQSSNESTIPIQYFTHEFTASNDGYALLTNGTVSGDTITSTIRIVDTNENSRFSGKKWGIIGDSLSDPTINTSIKKYYSYIEDNLGLTIQNVAKSGCGYKRIDPNNINGKNFVQQSLLIDNDADIITIFGSFNDNHEFSNMGTINDTTTDTLLGCVYTTFNNLITNNPNAKICVILPTPWPGYNPFNITTNVTNYISGIKSIASKFSIPVLDLFTGSNMWPWNDNFKASYYLNGDGVHPDSIGNERFAYQVENIIKSLI